LSRAGDYPADVVLLDSVSPGSGQVFDWQLAEAPDGLRLVLAGGLTPANVADAIAQVHPWGVDVVTGVETSPGRKDLVKVRAFIAAAKAAGARPYVAGDDAPFDQDDV
jgi:phosphoribosylanthranilate isomerase